MKYDLTKSTAEDLMRLIKYKKATIFAYADNLPREEIDRINSYIEKNVPKELDDYQNIVVDGRVVGCLLLSSNGDELELDEIYLESDFRGQGIGKNIIKKILLENDPVYLWVYKANTKAVSLYKSLNFKIIQETETRYRMKHTNKMKAITIKEPWATLIAEGYKEYEFRTWKTNFRGEILIHAGKGVDRAAMKRFQHLNLKYSKGAIIAKATITDCVKVDDELKKFLNKKDPLVYKNIIESEDYRGFGFKLENVEKVEPVEKNGRLGIWNVNL